MIAPKLITNNQSSNFRQAISLIILYCLLFIGIWNLVITLNVPKVNAESLSVSLRVGDTRVSFAGYASPGAYLTVKQNNAVISTFVADNDGNFAQIIEATNPGLQNFILYAKDSHNLLTPSLSYDVDLVANTLTTISNIVLPPTVALDQSQNVVSGMTHPLSTLTLVIDDSTNLAVPVAPGGTWSYTLSQSIAGSHTLYLIATIPNNYLSLASRIIIYAVASQSSPTPAASTTNSSALPIPSTFPSPSLAPSPTPLASLLPPVVQAALDTILRVFLPSVDVPLTIQHLTEIVTKWIDLWQAQTVSLTIPITGKHSGSCDFNHDQKCDLTDLSILLYFIKP